MIRALFFGARWLLARALLETSALAWPGRLARLHRGEALTPWRYLAWRILGRVQGWALNVADWCGRRRRKLIA